MTPTNPRANGSPTNTEPRLTDSVISVPRRNNRWGDFRYRGNCDGTLFRELVLRYEPRSVLDPMMGSGTTRDVIRDLIAEGDRRIRYFGTDLKKGFDIQTSDLDELFDLVWVHPPYWNIVRYSDSEDDLSTLESWEEFRVALALALHRCHERVAPGGRLAVLVGDVRKRGRYYPLIREVLNLDGKVGELRSVIIKLQHNCQSESKTYGNLEDVRITHEYCAVFKRAA
ncbi:MAG: hypothetical protein RLN60_02175 [Phycisphaerales bacterium]